MKYLSFNKNHGAVLITLLFVLFFGALYFFIYVPQNEKRVQEQRFRTLQNVHDNIQAKIFTSVAMMNNLLNEPVNNQYIEYLSQQSKDRFTLTLPGNKSVKKQKDVVDSGYTVAVNNINREITLRVVKKFNAKDSTSFGMDMKFTFDQFLNALLPQNVFDQYIVFSEGDVVYETFPSGVTYTSDSLLGKRGGITTSTVKSLNVGGNDYKIFLQPLNFGSTGKWVVSGLLSNQRYQEEKNQLPSNIVLLLLTAVLIIIVAFPWLKLYQMGSKDRLTVSDGVASIVVAMLLMSLLFFSFFKYNVLLRPDISEDSKNTLANEITNTFKSEVDVVYDKLHQIDTLVSNHIDLFTDLHDLNNEGIYANTTTHRENLATVDSILKGLNVNQLLWLDSSGTETVNWFAGKQNAPHGNFSHREYFKQLQQHRYIIADHDTSRKFYLDQIVSYTTGKFTSVLSIPSSVPGQAIAAISFDLKAVAKPVITAGYQFAIINNAGKVLYHSDSTRNLNENLLSEFAEKDKLTSCLQARSSGVFITKYFSKNYNVRVSPMPNLPYYILVLGDISYKETRDMEIYSFTFSMLLILFALLILQLFVMFFVSSRQSFFKKQAFNTSWVGPKISFADDYNLATFANIAMMCLLVFFFHLSTFLEYFFILLFSVSALSIFLNAIYARHYRKVKQADNYGFKIRSIVSLIIFLVIINVAAWKMLDRPNFFSFFLYQVIATALGFVLYFKGSWILLVTQSFLLSFTQRFSNKIKYPSWGYAKSFSLMALTRLIITSGIPILFFYISSYNYEQNIAIRYRQLQFANQLTDRLTENQLDSFNNKHGYNGYYLDKSWINSIAITNKTEVEPYTKEENITTKFLGIFRLYFTDHAVNEDKLYVPQSTDQSVYYNPLLKDAIQKNHFTTTYKATRIPGKYVSITAAPLNYQLPSVWGHATFRGFIFWLLLLLALIGFYFIVYKIISKLFCLRLPNLSAWKSLDDKILTNSKLNNLVFVIGLPGSGKLGRIKSRILAGEINDGTNPYVWDDVNPERSQVAVADLINIPDYGDTREKDKEWTDFLAMVFAEKNKVIIVNHFEYNIQDAVTNRIKLNFLERLMLENKCKIIILSTIHPVAFLDSVLDQSIAVDDKNVPGQDLERWHVLLGHYRIVVLPLEPSENMMTDPSWRSIYKETQLTHFLNKMQQPAIEIAKLLPEKQRAEKVDELAFKLQVTSHYFYMYIWQSLTKEEKFLLYDLAEDNLVNSFDDYNLNLLVAKGIILRPDGTLSLFNRGFRNFILTAIGNSEVMKIKRHIKENGNWSRLKNPLLIIIVAILTFLLASQEETYSKLITYVAALGAGIPTVLRIVSFFETTGQKKDS
jgi:hypothetical protein